METPSLIQHILMCTEYREEINVNKKANQAVLSIDGQKIEEVDATELPFEIEIPNNFVTWDTLAEAYREGVESIG